MTRESVSVEELIAALNELKAQVEWIVERGHGAFVASTSEAGVLQLAASHAVIRLQAIIEDFPEGFTQNNSDLPFPLVRGMRNRMAHGYHEIDPQILWRTAEMDLPDLIESLLHHLDSSQ